MKNEIYIGNLPYSITPGTLAQFLESLGVWVSGEDLRIPRMKDGPHAGSSRGFAFAALENEKQVIRAVGASGTVLAGREIIIKRAVFGAPKRKDLI